jgi:hypothetical protein
VSTTEHPVEIDADKLMQFVFRAVEEVDATLNAALVVIGDKLGLYRAIAGTGGLSPTELAVRTGTAERYVREWLNTQAAGGYVEYDPESGRYALPPEQTVAFTDPDSPAYLPGFFQIAVGSVLDSPKILEAARSGDGLGWHEHVHDVHDGCERFFRPGYNAHLTAEWLPALDGVVEKLKRGALVADVGCGHGSSTILMAQALPGTRAVPRRRWRPRSLYARGDRCGSGRWHLLAERHDLARHRRDAHLGLELGHHQRRRRALDRGDPSRRDRNPAKPKLNRAVGHHSDQTDRPPYSLTASFSPPHLAHPPRVRP